MWQVVNPLVSQVIQVRSVEVPLVKVWLPCVPKEIPSSQPLQTFLHQFELTLHLCSGTMSWYLSFPNSYLNSWFTTVLVESCCGLGIDGFDLESPSSA